MLIKKYNSLKREKKYMKKGFTIVEVSILFVIFLIVAFLVAPLSLDDTMQEKNISRWRNVQSDFNNIFYSIKTQDNAEEFNFEQSFNSVMKGEIKSDIKPYKIIYMNGAFPDNEYRFYDYKLTYFNATLSYKLYDTPQTGVLGVMMYDVNGEVGPNAWGKDVFGYNIYPDRLEPLCKNKPVTAQKQDCSKSGSGLCCSNYYLVGGSFN